MSFHPPGSQPFSPIVTDQICFRTTELTDWNVVKTPDPVEYTSLMGEDVNVDTDSFTKAMAILEAKPEPGKYTYVDGTGFEVLGGSYLNEFIMDSVELGGEINDSLNATNPHLGGDLKAIGQNLYTDGVSFDTVTSNILGSNTYRSFEADLNEGLNDYMTGFGLLDEDKWKFEIGLNHIPTTDRLDLEASYHYTDTIHRTELWKNNEDNWFTRCGFGVQATYTTKGYMSVDLLSGEVMGGAGLGVATEFYLQLLGSDGEASGWGISYGTGVGFDTQEGWYGPGESTISIMYNFTSVLRK